jgi:hypothetical protein
MSKKSIDHPALASAKRAIRRALAQLTPVQVFSVACVVETLAYGEDRGHWGLSIAHAARTPHTSKGGGK